VIRSSLGYNGDRVGELPNRVNLVLCPTNFPLPHTNFRLL